MSIEYRLTLAGETPVQEIVARALPEADVQADVAQPYVADVRDRYGFTVTVRAGRNGYHDAESDAGPWEWEPESYVNVTFRLDKTADPEQYVRGVVGLVARVLRAGAEDAALILNGDRLLLTRFGGVLAKHHRDLWWDHYGFPHEVVRG